MPGPGKVGKAVIDGTNSGTVSWTGGGSSTAGNLNLLLYTSNSTSTDTPATPTNYTLVVSAANSSGNFFLYERFNAPSAASLNFSMTASPDSATLDWIEISGYGSRDSGSASPTVATASSGTTLTTNAVTTSAASTILCSFFAARHGVGGPRTLTLGTDPLYTVFQSNNQSTGGSGAQTSLGCYKIVSSTQSAVTSNCASDATTAWNATIVAYDLSSTALGGDEGEGIVIPQWQWRHQDHNYPISRRGKRLHRKYLEEMRRVGCAA